MLIYHSSSSSLLLSCFFFFFLIIIFVLDFYSSTQFVSRESPPNYDGLDLGFSTRSYFCILFVCRLLFCWYSSLSYILSFSVCVLGLSVQNAWVCLFFFKSGGIFKECSKECFCKADLNKCSSKHRLHTACIWLLVHKTKKKEDK